MVNTLIMNDSMAWLLTVSLLTIIPYLLGRLVYHDDEVKAEAEDYWLIGLLMETVIAFIFGIGYGIYGLLKLI